MMPTLNLIHFTHNLMVDGHGILNFISTFFIANLPSPSGNLIKLIR